MDRNPADLTPYRKLLLFGGSFDPPHRAHIALPQIVAEQIGADVVAYIPAGRAPHKLDRKQTPPEHRLAMLELALAGLDHCIILTDELDRDPAQPSYTVDTLEALSGRLSPGTTMRLLVGADQLRIFDSWRDPERVVAFAEPAVMVRPPDTRETLLDSLPDDAARAAWSPRLVEVPAMQISSTEIRRRVAAGLPLDDLTPGAVEGYIQQHGLYPE
ncbi:MAG: nicotinate (nicotinamide) nucleotide adenylyltransferase [Planctomycetota bacterium]